MEDREAGSQFMGNFAHLLDAKGRVSVPAAWRQFLLDSGEQSIVITNFICDGARCLDGFTYQAWRQFEEKLRSRSRFDPQVRKLENYYLARAALCSVDGNGRVNIPQHLRDYAGMDKEVMFTSALHGFRIWDRRVWEMIFSDAESALLEDPALFVNVDI